MKRPMLSVLVGGTIALSVPGTAGVAADLSVKKSVSLKGSPEATWSLVGDYCGIPKWDSDVAKCEIVSGTNNRAGAVRVLTLGDGVTIREKLVTHDAKLRTYSYTILESPLPVVSYLSTMTVLPGPAGGSIVEWTSHFKAAPGTDEAAARSAIEGIYEAALNHLRAREAGK